MENLNNIDYGEETKNLPGITSQDIDDITLAVTKELSARSLYLHEDNVSEEKQQEVDIELVEYLTYRHAAKLCKERMNVRT